MTTLPHMNERTSQEIESDSQYIYVWKGLGKYKTQNQLRRDGTWFTKLNNIKMWIKRLKFFYYNSYQNWWIKKKQFFALNLQTSLIFFYTLDNVLSNKLWLISMTFKQEPFCKKHSSNENAIIVKMSFLVYGWCYTCLFQICFT